MSERSPRQVTQLLADARAGGRSAISGLMELVYEELRGLAHHQMAKVPGSDTLQPTALVHEAYVRLVGRDGPGWEDRAHFFNAAARAMRDIIVEQARKHARLKRGGGRKRVTFDEAVLATADQSEDLLALDEALVRLEKSDPGSAEVVMLRFFAGMTVPDTARAMGSSPATVDRQWRYARAWLRSQLRDEDGASDEHAPG